MFEVFGWASVCTSTYDINSDEDEVILGELRELIKRCKRDGLIEVRIYESLNGSLNGLTVIGLRNHRYEKIIDLYKWLADNAPGSYGLLYVWDDESQYDNEFRVLRLARGELNEMSDPFLSPRIPKIEDPYDPEKDKLLNWD